MGGVDLLDQLIGLYRIYIRSRKWTLRMIFHAVDFAIVNSWIEYRKDCCVNENEALDLMHFRLRIAEALVNATSNIRSRGRPSLQSIENIPKRKRMEETRPIPEVRRDSVDHLPDLDGEKEGKRCKQINCGKKTHFFCVKCKVHLCIKKKRQELFHGISQKVKLQFIVNGICIYFLH